MYPKLILYNNFLIYNMFIIYNLGILCIEYLQMHIHTHKLNVMVHLCLGILCLKSLRFANSQSAFQMIPLVSSIVCK